MIVGPKEGDSAAGTKKKVYSMRALKGQRV